MIISTELLEMFKSLISKDITLLIEETSKIDIFKKIFKENIDFSIKFEFFKVMIDSLCFKIKNGDDPTDLHKSNKNLEERLDLCEKVLFSDSKIKELEYVSFRGAQQQKLPDKLDLFYRFYYEVFRNKILIARDIPSIIDSILAERREIFQKFKFPTNMYVLFPNCKIKDPIRLNDEFQILPKRKHIRVVGSNDFELYEFPNLINYNTTLSCSFFSTFQKGFEKFLDLRIKFEAEWYENVSKKVLELILSVYLTGKAFEQKNQRIIYNLPWWWQDTHEDDLNYFNNNNPPYSFILSSEELNRINVQYSEVKESQIFMSNQFDTLRRRYNEVFNTKFFEDLIISSFIIFELFFTRGIAQELRFRLCLNGALFLSSKFEKLEKHYNFFWSLYELKQKIIHGGNLKKSLNELSRKMDSFSNKVEIMNETRRIVNKCILKLIELKKNNSNPIKQFKSLYFFENCSIILKEESEEK